MYVVDEGEAKIVAEPQWAHLQEAQGDGRQPPGGEGLVGVLSDVCPHCVTAR